jgi:hypothetical protein
MTVSPFTFYRSTATTLAADLKEAAVAGLDAQAMRGCSSVELPRLRSVGADLGSVPRGLMIEVWLVCTAAALAWH